MKSKEFVIWLDGYLEGKKTLNIDEIRHLQNKIADVNLYQLETDKEIIIERINHPMNPIKIQEPYESDDMDFPGKPPNIYM